MATWVDIMDGMAMAIWQHAHVQHFGPRATMHAVPDAAIQAAEDLERLYCKMNCVEALQELMTRGVDIVRTTERETRAAMNRDFGYRLGRSALGLPIQGHLPTALTPAFHIKYDGNELVWDGQIDLGLDGRATTKANPGFGIRVGTRVRTPHGIGEVVAVRESMNVPGERIFDVRDESDGDIIKNLRLDDLEPSAAPWTAPPLGEPHPDSPFHPKARRAWEEKVRESGEKFRDETEPRRRRNPEGVLTAKGERMYEHVKASHRGDPRAAEIAMRTVYARARDGAPGLVRNPCNPWPASQVQSILFAKGSYTEHQAKAWAKEHGYHYGDVEGHGSYWRLRQLAPTGGPCRTIEFGDGIKAVVCSGGRGRPPGVPNPSEFEDDLEHWDE